jgi:hypothetical protein
MIKTIIAYFFPAYYRTPAELPTDQWRAYLNVLHMQNATHK